MNEALHERVRLIRERALIRSWEYRQREHAQGVWYRLRRALVDAAEAWIIDDRDAGRLECDDCAPLPVGRELAPPKRLFFATSRQLAALPSRRRVPVSLNRELLEAPNLVLVPHR